MNKHTPPPDMVTSCCHVVRLISSPSNSSLQYSSHSWAPARLSPSTTTQRHSISSEIYQSLLNTHIQAHTFRLYSSIHTYGFSRFQVYIVAACTLQNLRCIVSHFTLHCYKYCVLDPLFSIATLSFAL